nr:glycoside hydrolase family 13 protein [Maliibacterium massiliense]
MDIPLYHHSHMPLFRTPFGAVPQHTSITLRLGVDPHLPCKAPHLHLFRDGTTHMLPMTRTALAYNGYDLYEVTIRGQYIGALWYCFCVPLRDGGALYWGDNPKRVGGEGWMYYEAPPAYLITVYAQDFSVPAWFRDKVMYQIFPDRFFRSAARTYPQKPRMHADWQEEVAYSPLPDQDHYCADDFFGGNLAGIAEKLPYLKSLGVSVLYLNPIFLSISNHRYNTADYETIDPLLGTADDLRDLCEKARAHGISILLDGVFSHTGAISRYFNADGRFDEVGAAQSPDSPYAQWYTFIDWPERYECWWGDTSLPNTREDSMSYMDYMLGKNGIVRKWLRLGARGWRLDVADELPDVFLNELHAACKRERADAVVLGEVWEDAATKTSYGHVRHYVLGNQLESVMNYPLRNVLINYFTYKASPEDVAQQVMVLKEHYPRDFFHSLMNMTGSHDVPRLLSLLSDVPQPGYGTPREHIRLMEPTDRQKTLGRARVRLMASVLFTLPGNPCIYYGDEAGLTGMTDPFCRRTFPWGREDEDLQAHFRHLGQLHNAHGALCGGDVTFAQAGEDILCYLRSDASSHIVVAVNRSEDARVMDAFLPNLPADCVLHDLYGGPTQALSGQRLRATLPPLTALILAL